MIPWARVPFTFTYSIYLLPYLLPSLRPLLYLILPFSPYPPFPFPTLQSSRRHLCTSTLRYSAYFATFRLATGPSYAGPRKRLWTPSTLGRFVGAVFSQFCLLQAGLPSGSTYCTPLRYSHRIEFYQAGPSTTEGNHRWIREGETRHDYHAEP